MAISQTQLLATARYHEKAYDSIAVRLKKGTRDFYKKEAAKRGLSLAMLIKNSVEEYIANHQPEQAAE